MGDLVHDSNFFDTCTLGFSIPDPFSQSRDSGLGDF